MPVWFQRGENLAVAAFSVVAFVALDFAWWWLLALFLIFDLSMVGYLRGPTLGAWTYNTVHNYIAPACLGAFGIALDLRWALFVALVWAFHIAIDRALGYGLKLTDAFTSTHLGQIGRPPSRD